MEHMGCIWDVYGMYMGCIWDVYGMSMGCIWDVYGMSMGCIWDVYGMLGSELKTMMFSYPGMTIIDP